VRVISRASLFFIFHITFENKTHVKPQNSIQPKAIDRKDKVQCAKSPEFIVVHSNIIHKTTRNRAKAVPSLNKLSHSNIRASLLGAQILLNIESTATGSVAEISVQKSKQTIKGISKPINGNKKNSPAHITNDEIINQKTANEPIIFQFFIISL
jgi:hypothetical protein